MSIDHPNHLCGKKSVSISLLEKDNAGNLDSSPPQSSECDEGDFSDKFRILTSDLQTEAQNPAVMADRASVCQIQLKSASPEYVCSQP